MTVTPTAPRRTARHRGAFNGGVTNPSKKSPTNLFQSVRKLCNLQWDRLPDRLTTRKVAFVLGVHKRSVNRSIWEGRLRAERGPLRPGLTRSVWYVEKAWLADHVALLIEEAQLRGFIPDRP